MNDFIPVSFFAGSDVVVVGQHDEMADIENPRGYIYGFASYVIAEDEAGNRVQLFIKSARQEAVVLAAAEKQAAALNVRLSLGKLPVNFGSWEHARPAYGSQAYIEYGADDDIALERREEEESFF
jgi:hypothetical protein